jgi:flagellar hook-associated protein 2
VSAINTQAAGEVQASIVNVGSSGSPDYRLSLRASSLGASAIALTDGSNNSLIASSTAGSLASYKLDGLPDSITSTSRTITLAPGVQVNLLGQSAPGAATTVTIADDASGLSAAFQAFAQSYNAAVDAVAQQHGQGGGVLEGDSLLQSLSGVLSQLGTYSNGSPAQALANFGITVDKTGHMSVDSAAFQTAANANFPALLSTLGNSTTGGFLETATNLMSGLEDPVTGIVKSEESSLATRITAQQTAIGDQQARVSEIQQSLTAQIAKADEAIASLESQVSYVTGLFAQYTGASSSGQSNAVNVL